HNALLHPFPTRRSSDLESVPSLARITAAAPDASFRIVGKPIARETARYSGRTAMRANVEIRERKPPPDPDAPLAFSMEGYYGTRDRKSTRLNSSHVKIS